VAAIPCCGIAALQGAPVPTPKAASTHIRTVGQNAPRVEGRGEAFQVTHPYHPLFGQKFKGLAYWVRGAEKRVYFRDVGRRIASIPLAFTSLAAPDPFLVVSAGRSHFRVGDLVELSRLIKSIDLKGKGEV
jgi:hypothetical protein